MESELSSHYPNCVFSKLVTPPPITHPLPTVARTHVCSCSGSQACAERKRERGQEGRGGEEEERGQERRGGEEEERGVTAADDDKARDQVGSYKDLEARDRIGAEVSADLGDKHVSPGSNRSDKVSCCDRLSVPWNPLSFPSCIAGILLTISSCVVPCHKHSYTHTRGMLSSAAIANFSIVFTCLFVFGL